MNTSLLTRLRNARFSNTEPGPIGLVGVLLALAVGAGLLYADKLPFVESGREFHAMFAEAGGLADGDQVKVAGLKVGRVTDVTLDGATVRVDFDVSDHDVLVGDRSRVAIKTDTLLGQRSLEIDPAGPQLAEGGTIPLERTQSPYNLTDALGTLTTKLGQTDDQQVAAALNTLSDTFQNTPPQLRDTLAGLTRLSKTINSRDEALRQLLDHSDAVSGVLAQRSPQFKTLVTDGNLLLGELQRRRAVIADLLTNTRDVADQLNGLVDDNRTQLGPTLDRLNAVIAVLQDNEGNLSAALPQLGSFATSLGEAVASAPFFTAYVENLIPGNLIGPQLAAELGQPPLRPAPPPGDAPSQTSRGGGTR
jgi:phospholipid/cholesterol/gamma-HCH transport system substrate-binding protein